MDSMMTMSHSPQYRRNRKKRCGNTCAAAHAQQSIEAATATKRALNRQNTGVAKTNQLAVNSVQYILHERWNKTRFRGVKELGNLCKTTNDLKNSGAEHRKLQKHRKTKKYLQPMKM